MLWSIVQSFIQHSLTGIGGSLVAKGMLTNDQSTQVVGAIMVIIGVGHSLIEKWLSNKQPPSSSAGTPQKIPILILSVTAIAAFATFGCGCQSETPQQATYQAAGTTVVTVDAAMTEWGAYVAANHPGTNAEMTVENAYEKYQAAMAVVCDAGAAYSATGGTNGMATAALNQAIANSGQDLTDLETLITSFGVQLQ